MVVSEALSKGQSILRNPLEVEILLSFAIGRPRENFIAHPESKISDGNAAKFRMYCEKRLSGVPLAYITHYKEFFGLGFYVDECVLIPRPETELVVEEAVKQGAGDKGQVICDVGTGSGCIAIALAKALPQVKIVALDISKKALKIAKKNCKIHGVEKSVELVESDLLSAAASRHFDGIVANLPYIGVQENRLVEKEVADFEPHEALFAGKNGLELFGKLFAQIAALARPPKWLVAETGFSQRLKLDKLIKKYFGKKTVCWKRDLAGLDRALVLQF